LACMFPLSIRTLILVQAFRSLLYFAVMIKFILCGSSNSQSVNKVILFKLTFVLEIKIFKNFVKFVEFIAAVVDIK